MDYVYRYTFDTTSSDTSFSRQVRSSDGGHVELLAVQMELTEELRPEAKRLDGHTERGGKTGVGGYPQ